MADVPRFPPVRQARPPERARDVHNAVHKSVEKVVEMK